jgi:hypothetical protein
MLYCPNFKANAVEMTVKTSLIRAVWYVLAGTAILFVLLLWFALGPQNYAVPNTWAAAIYFGGLVIGFPLLTHWYRHRWNRGFSDTFWYVTGGLLVLLGILLWLTYVPDKYTIPNKWGIFGIITIIMSVYVIRAFRHTRKSGGFWALLLGLFALHIFVFAMILRLVQQWPAILYVVIVPVELKLIELILGKVFHAEPEAPDV